MTITYEILREIRRKEEKSQKLQPLPENFYEEVKEYIKDKLEVSSQSMTTNLHKKELENAIETFQRILKLRIRKIIEEAIGSIVCDYEAKIDNMTNEEREFFEELLGVMKKHTTKLFSYSSPDIEDVESKENDIQATHRENVVADATVKEEEKNNSEIEVPKIKVRFLRNFPSILGVDLKTYGPFAEGEIVELPEKNAKIFIEKKIAIHYEAA